MYVWDSFLNVDPMAILWGTIGCIPVCDSAALMLSWTDFTVPITAEGSAELKLTEEPRSRHRKTAQNHRASLVTEEIKLLITCV